jgi:hypothetical protein
MPRPDPQDEALTRLLAEFDELTRRILAGEDAGTVLAELEHRAADRRLAIETRAAEIQAEADALTAAILRHEGRLQ